MVQEFIGGGGIIKLTLGGHIERETVFLKMKLNSPPQRRIRCYNVRGSTELKNGF